MASNRRPFSCFTVVIQYNLLQRSLLIILISYLLSLFHLFALLLLV